MKKIRFLTVIAAAVILAVYVSGCGKKEDESARNTQWFADLDTKDIDGNPVTKDIFADKELTLINVWATFCGPCVREMPELEELYREYQDGNVGIVGLLVDSSTAEYMVGLTEDEKILGQKILEETGVTYPQITVSEGLLKTDFTRVVQYPTTFFVDKNGNFVGDPISGAHTKEEWKELIGQYLKLAEGEA